jgi:hypothetical protein
VDGALAEGDPAKKNWKQRCEEATRHF